MARKVVFVSESTSLTIERLSARLAEMDWAIVSVDQRFARSAWDTIAVPKKSPSADSIIWIRPEGDGSVCVRPYEGRALRLKVKKEIEKLRKSTGVPLHWRQKPLFFVSEAKVPWYERISPDGRETLKGLKVAFW
ncbi:hypothetical protein HZC00_04910 [Candidatus Kaiserbacteria bacterium]|nr:hypothetical protein [Candidatus Kaiserbacteria bacterium]